MLESRGKSAAAMRTLERPWQRNDVQMTCSATFEMLQNSRINTNQADVAQLVEQPIRNRQVSGSSPLVGSILSKTPSKKLLFTVCKQ